MNSTCNSGGTRTQLSANIGGTVSAFTGTVAGGTKDFVNTFGYDYDHRMTSVAQAGVSGGNAVASKRVDITYFADGQFQSIAMRQSLSTAAPDVATSTFGYDSVGRLTGLAEEQASTSTTFANYSYSYNADNTVATFSNSVHSSEDAAYGYDPTGQLTSATYVNDMANNATYGFDANGNLNTGGSTVGSPSSTTGANQISSDGTYNYYYDAVGNLTKQVKISDSSEIDYAYDNRNRLTSVTNKDSSGRITQEVWYAYDAFNRLVTRDMVATSYDGYPSSVHTLDNFIYDGNSMVLQLDGGGNVEKRVLNGAAVDQVFAQEDSSNTTTWALSDNQNTVRDLVQFNAATGNDTVVDHRTYNAFGQPLSTPAVDFLFGYTGKYYDTATGLQWNLNRWYNPQLQRWMTQDPSGLGPDTNPYRYVGNQPTVSTDPFGLATSPTAPTTPPQTITVQAQPLPGTPGVPILTRPPGVVLNQTQTISGVFQSEAPTIAIDNNKKDNVTIVKFNMRQTITSEPEKVGPQGHYSWTDQTAQCAITHNVYTQQFVTLGASRSVSIQVRIAGTPNEETGRAIAGIIGDIVLSNIPYGEVIVTGRAVSEALQQKGINVDVSVYQHTSQWYLTAPVYETKNLYEITATTITDLKNNQCDTYISGPGPVTKH